VAKDLKVHFSLAVGVGRREALSVRITERVLEAEIRLRRAAGLELAHRRVGVADELAGDLVVPGEEDWRKRTVEAFIPALRHQAQEQRDVVTRLLVLAEEGEVVPLEEIVREVRRAAVPGMIARQMVKPMLPRIWP